jgi:hypothetical protein|tara:strand:- start:160 stop:864 length:705 start_codon:yes stop_codon:yes gene_type:complete
MSKTEDEAIAAFTRWPNQPRWYGRRPARFDDELIDKIVAAVGWPKGMAEEEKPKRKETLQLYLEDICLMVHYDSERKSPTLKQQQLTLRKLTAAVETAISSLEKLLGASGTGELPPAVRRALKVGGANNPHRTVRNLMEGLGDLEYWAATAAGEDEALAYTKEGRRDHAIANLANVYANTFNKRPGIGGPFIQFLQLCLPHIFKKPQWPGSMESGALQNAWKRVKATSIIYREQ